MQLFNDMVGALAIVAVAIWIPVACKIVAEIHCDRLDRARRDDEYQSASKDADE